MVQSETCNEEKTQELLALSKDPHKDSEGQNLKDVDRIWDSLASTQISPSIPGKVVTTWDSGLNDEELDVLQIKRGAPTSTQGEGGAGLLTSQSSISPLAKGVTGKVANKTFGLISIMTSASPHQDGMLNLLTDKFQMILVRSVDSLQLWTIYLKMNGSPKLIIEHPISPMNPAFII
ncbi:hypothetical protein M404DRAFT_8724 [Pisolithus tinctorius Marx 270]|uniref:Uncharacterized protein n=1 Tax=Pisolithus tinctorius Marx 270 TaxID=870435 RepID=A0A0C3JCF4_PISTI|nr:hypothetical protein M404DRAFT_8724 [Pisolithus tinctorius Marx 270]